MNRDILFLGKELQGFQHLVFYGLLENLGKSWTTSKGSCFYRQRVRTTKPRARAIAVRYFLTYSGKGL